MHIHAHTYTHTHTLLLSFSILLALPSRCRNYTWAPILNFSISTFRNFFCKKSKLSVFVRMPKTDTDTDADADANPRPSFSVPIFFPDDWILRNWSLVTIISSDFGVGIGVVVVDADAVVDVGVQWGLWTFVKLNQRRFLELFSFKFRW